MSDELYNMAEDLRDAAMDEGSELGEMWEALVDVYNSALYSYGPEEVQTLVDRLIRENHDLLVTEYRKVTKTETKEYTVTRWVWNEEED